MFHYIFQQVFCKCSPVAVTVLYNSFTYAAGGADGWRRRRTRRTAPRGRAGGRLWRRRRRHRDGYCPSLRRRRRVHQRCRLQRFPRLTAEVGLGHVLRPKGPPPIAGPGRYMPGRVGSICNEYPDTDTEAWALAAARAVGVWAQARDAGVARSVGDVHQQSALHLCITFKALA